MRKRPNAARDREINRLMMDSATYDEIGRKYQISRQRVHQIVDARRLAVPERRAAVEGALAPFMAQPLEPRCCRCGTVKAVGRRALCAECQQLVRTIRRIKALLRAAKRGHAQALRQAKYEIAHSGLNPADLSLA